jgi:hypothetical protein
LCIRHSGHAQLVELIRRIIMKLNQIAKTLISSGALAAAMSGAALVAPCGAANPCAAKNPCSGKNPCAAKMH